MPLLETSQYSPPRLFSNPHLQTIHSSMLRRVRGVHYQRVRIDTPDRDFLDIDISLAGARRAAIITHGLEGSSRSTHVLGMSRALNRAGWDTFCWNLRGCSGEPNRTRSAYHSGSTSDLDCVVRFAMSQRAYSAVSLVGFSMGGNLQLNYLGELGSSTPTEFCGSVAISTPCDLKESAEKLALGRNKIYMFDFLRYLKHKVRAKKRMFPEEWSDRDFHLIKSFRDYDDRYTAPLHGFRDAEDYWSRCSSSQRLHTIRVPTLILNAVDDPFLGPNCSPLAEARRSRFIALELPKHGGHLGFVEFNRHGDYWSERRTVEILADFGGFEKIGADSLPIEETGDALTEISDR
jgi:predicted alpha/beta-fold hydrolase